jgi:hypothetical protein
VRISRIVCVVLLVVALAMVVACGGGDGGTFAVPTPAGGL